MAVILEPPKVMYTCWTVVEEFRGHEGVTLTFYCGKRGGGLVLPYDRLIENYNDIPQDMRCYLETVIKEMFLFQEVESLGDYLRKYFGSTLDYSEEKMPIANNLMAWSDQPFSRGMGLCNLKQPGAIYTPSFGVMFGYDHRFCNCRRCVEREQLRLEKGVPEKWVPFVP